MMNWRNDGVAKVTGKAKYADDIKFFDMLHCVPVYTNEVHAEILSIDIGQAEKSKGVVKVITAKDIPGVKKFGQIRKDYSLIAEDKIRYEGDVIALILADTLENALNAVPKVSAKFKKLKAILSPEEASKDELLVHDVYGSNLINHHKVRKGDTDRGFSECDLIVEDYYETNFVEHGYLEPESAVCQVRDDGVIEVYGSMQHPFSTRRFTAALLGKKLSEIEVITIPMGGGFGGKDDTAAIVCARTALASWVCNKPVKMTYTREWSIKESYKRHPYKMNYRVGLKQGKIHALQCSIITDGGAYTSVSPWVTWRSTVQCGGPYIIPNVFTDVKAYYTNNVYTGAFRGFGSPQVNFAIEQIVEVIADKLGIDAITLRKNNMLRQDSVTVSQQKLDNHIVSLEQVLDRAIKESDYCKKIAKCSFGKGDDSKLYGIGLAMSYRGCSLGAEGKDFTSAIINVQFDGSILLEVAIHENGQGSETAMINILANEIGVPASKIRYRRSSTSQIPDGGTTVASRGTLMGGGALMDAIKNLKVIINNTIASELKCKPEEITYSDNNLSSPNGENISWEDAMGILYQNCTYPYAFGSFEAPKVTWNEENGSGNAYFTYVYSAQVAEVEIDIKSRKVKVLDIFAVHDIGKAINEGLLSGQVYGGVVQGLGMALKENMIIKDGHITTNNFHNYRMYRANELPRIHDFIIENPDPNTPSGAKGIGEPALEIISPAIANAIYRATGKRMKKLPMLAEDICKQ